MKIEIPTVLSTIDALVDDYGKLGYIPVLTITEIDAARQGYDRNRDWIILFRDESLRRDLLIAYGT